MPPQPSSPSARPSRGRALLVLLSRLPRGVFVLVVVALVVGGLAAPGVAGALLLIVVAALVVWLLSFSWAVLPGPARAMRVLLLGILAFGVWTKLAGR